ncbi:MAG: glycosyltransferase [Microcystaceae cyanobacterium]
MTTPILSIVIPTREGLSEHWFTELFKVEGNVEFILVHPPGSQKYSYTDPRLQQIISPFRGEVMQRMTALMTASGDYVLSMNCDEYLHPNVLDITTQYFQRFPESWVMRLSKSFFPYGQLEGKTYDWKRLPPINSLKEYSLQETREKRKIGELSDNESENSYLLKIPIAPLENKFSFQSFLRKRKDRNGCHGENFDKKVWKTSLVRETLVDLTQSMMLFGPIKYVPFWCLDRLLGLYLQAKFFEKDRFIGHNLPQPELLRIEDNPPKYSRSYRWYQLAEILLVKQFPQYGYLWNLAIDDIFTMISWLVKLAIPQLDMAQKKEKIQAN